MPRLSGALAGRAAVVLVAGVVGFLLVSQLRGQERFTQRLEAESEGDLARILSSLNVETDSLRDEIASLKLQLLSLESSGQRDVAAVKAAQDQLAALEVMAGTVPTHGPGISMRIDDPNGALHYDVLVDVVQELRDAGAEALAVDGRRLGATTAFGERDGQVTVDGHVVATPYEVEAIGAPETLEAGVAIPGGAVDTLRASKGVTVVVDRQADVQLPALATTPTFRAARPVASGS